MQAVGDLDQDDPHVVREREQDLAEIFGLLRGVGIEYARHLRKPIDHRGDLGPKMRSMSSTVYSVSSTTSCSRAATTDLTPRPISSTTILATAMGCRRYGSPERRLPPAMSLFGKEKCAFDELPVFVVLADFGARLKQFVPFLLDYHPPAV